MADYFTTSQLQLSRNYLDGDFNDVVFNSKNDPLTGLDTGSGNDRWAEPTGTDIKGNDPIVHHLGGNSGPGGTTFFTENIGGTSGPGGTSFLTGENGKAIVHPSFQPEADGYTEVEWTYLTENIGGTAGPGGSTYFSGYSEAVGLDGYMVCPEPPFLMNVGSTSGPGGTSFFTNFAMPVGDFI